MSGSRGRSTTVLSPDQQRVIAGWCLKTTMVFEFTGKDAPFYSFDERNALRTSALPPASTLVWLAHYVGLHISNAAGSRAVFDLEVDGHIMPLSAYYAAVTLGRLAFQTFTVRVPDGILGIELPMKDGWELNTVLIWPCAGSVVWPPHTGIDEDGFSRFVRWFENSDPIR